MCGVEYKAGFYEVRRLRALVYISGTVVVYCYQTQHKHSQFEDYKSITAQVYSSKMRMATGKIEPVVNIWIVQ